MIQIQKAFNFIQFYLLLSLLYIYIFHSIDQLFKSIIKINKIRNIPNGEWKSHYFKQQFRNIFCYIKRDLNRIETIF